MNEHIGEGELLRGAEGSEVGRSADRDGVGAVAARHTPGPWLYRLESTRYVIQHAPEGSPGLRAIAVTAGSYPLSEANAKLLAAAPDLLAALQMIITPYPVEYDAEICQIARAAIAKATGLREGGSE